MTTVTVLQPGYHPWIGYFEQIYRSDVFVFYCDVQCTKNDWRNRNKIKTHNSWAWLTVPMRYEIGKLISETLIDNSQNWQENHLKTIEQYYSKAPYFKRYMSTITQFYAVEYITIEQVAEASVLMLSKLLGLNTEFVCSKDLNINGNKSQRLLNVCQKFNASKYYCGSASENYLDVDIFEKSGIQVSFQKYNHPVYNQLHGEFIPFMSALDLLLCEGEKARDIIVNKKVVK